MPIPIRVIIADSWHKYNFGAIQAKITTQWAKITHSSQKSEAHWEGQFGESPSQ